MTAHAVPQQTDAPLLTEMKGPVLTVTLNRPEARNALSPDLMREIRAAFDGARDDRDVRCILLRGAGISFCAGGDTKLMAAQVGTRRAVDVRRRIMEVAYPMMRAVLDATVPVVAAVQGHAFGAGFSLALAADYIVATDDAQFSQAFTRRGLVPDCGSTLLLPAAIGRYRALDLMLTGRVLTAETAHQWGLVHEVVAGREQLDETALDLATQLGSGPTVALGLTRALATRGLSDELRAAMEAEAAGQAYCVESDDHQEGVRSFAERREPSFRGT